MTTGAAEARAWRVNPRRRPARHARTIVAADRNAVVHRLRVLAKVGGEPMDPERRTLLLTHAKALRHAALKANDHHRDVGPIEAVDGEAMAALSDPLTGAQAGAGAAG